MPQECALAFMYFALNTASRLEATAWVDTNRQHACMTPHRSWNQLVRALRHAAAASIVWDGSAGGPQNHNLVAVATGARVALQGQSAQLAA